MPAQFDADRLPRYTWPKLLTGQKALVTGASSGIGKAIALGFGRAGADVAINYHSDEATARQMVKEIEGFGVKAIAVKADVSKEDEVLAMYQTVLKAFGTFDILVANAGLQRDSALDTMTLEQWNKVIGTNLTGEFLCAREAVKEFKRRGVRPEVSMAAGKIICMSSVHQVIPWGGHANYAASKGGIHMLMQTMAQELAPLRIRVNGIGPGAIRTPINRSAWETPDAYAKLMELVPYQRIGEPEDIAQAAVFLASDMADYITGVTLFVDGGMTCFPGFATGG